MTTAQHTTIDWRQAVVNLEALLEAYDYNYGLEHDLVIARGELAKQEER